MPASLEAGVNGSCDPFQVTSPRCACNHVNPDRHWIVGDDRRAHQRQSEEDDRFTQRVHCCRLIDDLDQTASVDLIRALGGGWESLQGAANLEKIPKNVRVAR